MSLPALVYAQSPTSSGPASTSSESATAESNSIPTFHATSRLVLVDVVATDKTGKFVHGLRSDDFTVLEDGKPQRISGFSAHEEETAASPPPALQLPPHQYTNFSILPPGRAVNIVLLDLLNTPRLEQSYARQEMLKFLAGIPPGQTVAVFALSSRLTMVHGFTGNSDSPVAAAKALLLDNSTSLFRLDPQFNQEGQTRFERDHRNELLETAALMAASQIAVYPIDVTGLSADAGPFDSNKVITRWDRQDAMADIARQTGGVAFYGSNDLKSAMLRSIQESTNYYTLAYVPTNPDWNGRYRKIEMKVRQAHVELRHRSGYYAVLEPEFKGDQAAKMLASAMLPTVPESTMLLLRVQVLPPDREHKAVRIDYAVEAQDIEFTDTADKRKRAAIDFMAAAWDRHNQDVGHVTNTMETAIRPQLYEQALRTGIPMHQELDLKPGSYLLRLGVIDRGSQKIGTVDIPLTIPGSETNK